MNILTLLTWAFENIIKNAVDAIGMGTGKVIVNISRNELEKIQIDFVDSGKGISRKNWKNIFRPGFSTKKRGWGLGLSLTHRIINELHYGKVWVVRSQPGETVIRILFN